MLQFGKKVIVLDGGLGSELERRGLTGIPEDLNITHAQQVQDIHRSYACADIVTTNTFGLNPVKYHGAYEIERVAEKAIENARAAGKKVFFDVGPTGAMMAPMGTLSFDEAYRAYARMAEITAHAVDGYIAETFSDLYELKACVLALKEHSNVPVIATMTFDEKGRTLTGTTPEIAALTLAGLGVAALGVNCSLGPCELYDVVCRLTACSPVPVVVQPNRGLPVLRDGKAVYELDIETFDRYTQKFIEAGASVVGGCCGTTPAFIERIAQKYRGMPVRPRQVREVTAVCSGTRLTEIEGVTICGERLNPTGKPKLKEALLSGNYDYLIDEAVRQQEAGADILDLNVGLPQLNEPEVMQQAVCRVQEYTDLPLQIDSSDPVAIEQGCRYYCGVPLINSVNGDSQTMAHIFPIAARYGAVVLGLTMDENGVPPTAAARCEIAERIIATAQKFGIPRHKVMIDTLVLTASAEQKAVWQTTEALRAVRKLGVKTALGVSNVSFGLPNRPLLNKTFLTMAMTCGLNMPILNPLDGEMTGAVRAFAVLNAADENARNYIAAYKDVASAPATAAVSARPAEKEKADTLYDCVCKGLKNQAATLCEGELQTREPLAVVNDVLIRALTEVGRQYDNGTLYLPQLVAAAEAAKIAFAIVGERLPKGAASKGKVVLCTVKGDVHDIGKNIVKVVLESYGYSVIDLGKDTPAATVTAAYRQHTPLAVGLSALMTTTVKSMQETIQALREANCACPVFVGGAVLNAEIAREIGADIYTRDALEFVNTLERLTQQQNFSKKS